MDPDEQVLLSLETLPPMVQCVDRLYVATDGRLLVDASYAYTGYLGRTILDLVSHRHNRHSVVLALTTLVDALDGILLRTDHTLTMLYARGHVPDDVTHVCVGQVRRIQRSFVHLSRLVQTLKITYIVDCSIQQRLSNLLERLGGVEQRLIEISLFVTGGTVYS